MIKIGKKEWNFIKSLEDGEKNLTQVSKKVKIPLYTAVRLTKKLQDSGLIKTRKKGRKRLVSLTKSGESLNLVQDRIKIKWKK